jgi:D-alanyl-D-alanine carboxypeptidase
MTERRVHAVAAIYALATLLTAGVAHSSERSRADRQLERSMKGLVERPGGPPAAIAVIQRGDRRTVHRSGVADVESRRRAKARDRMRIASTSKAISGAAALPLVADGALSLDDTIGEWLPDQPAAWHEITLGQLLNHTSGLPSFTDTEAFRESVGAAPHSPPPPRALLGYVAGLPLNFPPGSRYQYSNSDNVAVGLIVAAATGNGYPAELRRAVFKPFGMGRTVLKPSPRIPAPLIRGYDTSGQRPADVTDVVDFGGWAWASGGIVSTPGNLGKFIRAYAGGKLFGGSTRAAQYRFVPDAHSEPTGPGRNSAGLALFRYETNCGTVYGHTGSILGYTQLIAANRNGRRSLTFTINTQTSTGDELLGPLRRAERRAVCATLAPG